MVVQKRELATYYELRRISEKFGFTDNLFPRLHAPVDYKERCESISPSRLQACIDEEISLIRLGIEEQKHDLKSTKRELGEMKALFGEIPRDYLD